MATAAVQQEPAWYEAQYNNRARVPEHGAVLARWTEASRLAREGLRHALDLPYGDSAAERLDVFAAERPGSPVLVFIHGGWWRALDKADHSFVAPAYVKAGAMVVVPNYGLCPAVTIEDIALQMTRALEWTWRHAAEHGGDPSRIVVAGHSAGGHLAAMLLACRWKTVAEDLPPRLVTGALSISGVFDLDPIRQAPFLQADLQLTPASVKRLSPAFFPRPRGPLYAVVGGQESDEHLRQNRLIRDQWGPSTVPVCETVVGKNHFDVLHEFVDPAARLHALGLRLLGLG
ncbi:alpha/beta hydrolase [Aquabacterium humicola]|uniref:alpha/beta hydrolase n=1 Tax=Aquabacterium humicola TaxID=3237377 RepID=UPI00254315CD|nr:alpha/beta hydrolase [Rubrivivax pictus]